MKRRKILIHIGAPKTASTTLQHCLFEKHRSLYFFGEDGAGHLCQRDVEVTESMIFDDDLHFPHEECSEIFKRHRELKAERALIYSNADIMASRVPMACARRLHDFLPEAEILLIIRNQLSAIPSFYANHGAFLKPAPPYHFHRFVSFDDWMNYGVMFIKYGPLASFFYSKYLDIYAELFGKDKIHVLLFEDFVQDKARFIRDLSAILEIDVGEALQLIQDAHERKRNTARLLRYHRFRSAFLWQVPLSRMIPGGRAVARPWRRWLRSGPQADGFVSKQWQDKIVALYAPGNAELVHDYGVPIQDHSYPMP